MVKVLIENFSKHLKIFESKGRKLCEFFTQLVDSWLRFLVKRYLVKALLDPISFIFEGFELKEIYQETFHSIIFK